MKLKKTILFNKATISSKKLYIKNYKIIRYISICIIIFILFSYITCFAADPKIISKLNSAFGKIRDWMIKLATPAAAIAIGTGVFITKFSFGDDDRILKGKRLIRTTLYSYGFIIAVELILKAIESLVG